MGKKTSYLIILITTYIFTYIFDVQETYTLLYMIIIMPVLDYISILYFKSAINIEINVSKMIIKKDDEVVLNIKYKNNGILPIPFIKKDIRLNSKISFNNNMKDRMSLSANEEVSVEYNFYGFHIGIGDINISKIEVRSLFGLFNHIIKKNHIKNIIIEPKCVDINGTNFLIEENLENDDIEYNNIYIGDPGDEYRRYNEGDPLNRVNWKLSSKLSTLMIRKSSKVNKPNKTFILDSYIKDENNYEDICDILIEGIIGVINELYQKEYEVSLLINVNEVWRRIKIGSKDDMSNLQINFSKYSFVKKEERFYNINLELKEKESCIIFTNNKDEYIRKLINDIEDFSSAVSLVTTNKNKMIDNELYLNNSYGIERF